MKTVKTAVIGAGAMGLRHLGAVFKTPEAEFVGICDLRPEALEKAIEKGAKKEQCFTDSEEMLSALKPECVIISTTAPSHAPLAYLAIDNGAKYLVVEKPFCTSLKDIDKLAWHAAEKGVKIAVNHGMRYDANHSFIKKLSMREELGPLCSVLISGGNMGMAMNASHNIEQFRILTGKEPESVIAWFDSVDVPNPRGAQFRDASGQIRFENANGQRLYIDTAGNQGHGFLSTIMFRNGNMVINYMEGTVTLTYRKPEDRDKPTTRYGLPSLKEVLDLPKPDAETTAAKVLSALLNDGDYPGIDVGRRVVRSLVAAYVSSENGNKKVLIDEALPEDRVFPWA